MNFEKVYMNSNMNKNYVVSFEQYIPFWIDDEICIMKREPIVKTTNLAGNIPQLSNWALQAKVLI